MLMKLASDPKHVGGKLAILSLFFYSSFLILEGVAL
jgi:hypothetical protein